MAKRPATGGDAKATPKRDARKIVAATSTTGSPAPPGAQQAPPVSPAPLATGATPPRSDDDTIKRIDELIKNARTTWFALLGALVFAAITLAGVKDVAFFVSDIETELPLVGFSVPIVSFFWAGGLLTAALYIYFHLYLEQLWQELGDAPARIGADPKAEPPYPGRPLADCIHPWLVSDTALRVRDWMRASAEEKPPSARRKFIDDVLEAIFDTAGYVEVLLIRLFRRLFGALAIVDLPTNEPRASRRRGMGWISNLVSVSLDWLFGLAVVAWFWWRSMPAHNPFLTFWLGAVLAMTIWVFFKSIDGSLSALSGKPRPENWKPFFLVVFAAIIGLTTVRTWIDPWEGQPRGNELAYSCTLNETFSTPQECWDKTAFRIDFLRPARADLGEVVFTRKPGNWQGTDIAEAEFRLRWCKERPDLRCTRILEIGAFKFPNVNEERAFSIAWNAHRRALLASMPKPDLRGADLRGAILAGASMEGINLHGARLDGADLREARLDDGQLGFANMTGADLSRAWLVGADLERTVWENANLDFAALDRAAISTSRLEGASMRMVSIDGTRFFKTLLWGNEEAAISLIADEASSWTGSAFRNVMFVGPGTSASPALNETFADGSTVLLSEASRPHKWCASILDNAEFFGRWRGYLDPEGDSAKDDFFNGHPPIPPSPC